MAMTKKSTSSSVTQVVNVLLGIALAACGVLLMMNHDLLRQGETILAGVIANPFTPGEMYVSAATHTFFWGMGTADMHGLRVTAECTSAFLLGPLFIVAGLVLTAGRIGTVRILVATIIASTILVLANQTRLALIAWATANWGVDEGYQWSHTVGGSIVVGIGVALALIAFLVTLSLGRNKQKSRKDTFQPSYKTADDS